MVNLYQSNMNNGFYDMYNMNGFANGGNVFSQLMLGNIGNSSFMPYISNGGCCGGDSGSIWMTAGLTVANFLFGAATSRIATTQTLKATQEAEFKEVQNSIQDDLKRLRLTSYSDAELMKLSDEKINNRTITNNKYNDAALKNASGELNTAETNLKTAQDTELKATKAFDDFVAQYNNMTETEKNTKSSDGKTPTEKYNELETAKKAAIEGTRIAKEKKDAAKNTYDDIVAQRDAFDVAKHNVKEYIHTLNEREARKKKPKMGV